MSSVFFCAVLRDGLLLLSECFIVSFPCCDGRGRQMKNIRENRGKDAEDHRKLLIRSDWCAFQMVQGSLSLSTLLGPCVSQTVRLSVRPSVRRPPLGGNASSFFHSSRSSLFPRLMPLLQLVRVYTPTFLFFPLPICFLLLLLVWGNSFQSFHLVEDFFFPLSSVERKRTARQRVEWRKKSGNNMASFLLCFLKDGQLDATAVSPPPSHFDDFLRAAKRRRRKKKNCKLRAKYAHQRKERF